MSKPEAPTPPNPYATAAAQTGTNVATGVANAYLNNVNQNTPDGSLSYEATGSHSWTDPTTGHVYNIPTFTSTQTLSPAGQALKTTNDQTQQNLASMAQQQSSRVGGLLSQPFTPLEGAPDAGSSAGLAGVPQAATSFAGGGPIQSSIGGYGQQQTTFDDAGEITRNYGPTDGFSADRQRVEESLYGRLNPQLQKDRSAIEQRLADQGIRYGSQAYSSAMDDYNRQSNDARLAVTAAGGQEQQRMTEMAAQRAGFKNAAQMQAYNQAQGRGTFANDAQSQNFAQALGAGSFANQAQGQQFQQNAALGSFQNAGLAQQLGQQQSIFNADNSSRNQYLQEQYQQRQQPLNEISGLMSGSQVQNPNWLNSPQSQIPTTDFAGIMNQNFQNQMGIYNTQQSGWNSTMGGLLGLGAGAIKASDERVKKNIDRVGTVFAYNEDAERKRLPIYEYEYKNNEGGPGRHVGPMAQDVEKLDRRAVGEIGGVKHIDTRRVMGNILRAA